MDNGTANVTIDDKGRFIFPKKMRDILEENSYIMTFSIDNCIQLLTKNEFEEMRTEIVKKVKHDSTNRNVRNLQRRLIGSATDVNLDKASRLSLPKLFRDITRLNANTEAVVLFYGSYFEIWSAIEYANIMNTTDYQAASDAVFGGE